jgi:hypothetical protein
MILSWCSCCDNKKSYNIILRPMRSYLITTSGGCFDCINRHSYMGWMKRCLQVFCWSRLRRMHQEWDWFFYVTDSDEVYPRQCPCRRAFDLWSELRTWRTRRRSNESRRTRGFTQVQPPRKVKGLRPACLTYIDVVAMMMVLQWRRRLDLAKVEGSKLSSAPAWGGWKVIRVSSSPS